MTNDAVCPDPFTVLGVAPEMDLDERALETRYRRLATESHPDFNRGLDAAAHVEMLERAARLNDAFHVLRDPWRRAVALIELRDAQAMQQTKTLCPVFLMEAMETREAVDDAALDRLATLRSEIEAKLAHYLEDVRGHLARGEVRTAATLVHQSNYYRKALADLKERIHAA
ncbi:MAG: Fe-S protein assembly co-chaperone HscB [Planctomycetes bacterium]|nr:Fe-S protein assembly co-chaperone HscB [Planctomycetota bacterium]